MKSIIQDQKRCYVTGSTDGLHKHHIYGAANRQISEDHGFFIYLRWDFHIADSPNKTPHNDRHTDLYYKRLCQKEFEKTHTREEFISLIGRNYL